MRHLIQKSIMKNDNMLNTNKFFFFITILKYYLRNKYKYKYLYGLFFDILTILTTYIVIENYYYS